MFQFPACKEEIRERISGGKEKIISVGDDHRGWHLGSENSCEGTTKSNLWYPVSWRRFGKKKKQIQGEFLSNFPEHYIVVLKLRLCVALNQHGVSRGVRNQRHQSGSTRGKSTCGAAASGLRRGSLVLRWRVTGCRYYCWVSINQSICVITCYFHLVMLPVSLEICL